jgi:large subunit ribosomal protein L30
LIKLSTVSLLTAEYGLILIGGKMGKLKITQVKSIIKTKKKQKLTIEALGLGRPNYSNVLPDNVQTRGMIEVVKHLVNVEEVSE